jgi:hypothetical protein
VSDASVESWIAILDTLSVHSFPLVSASADCVIYAIDTILDLARTRNIFMSKEYATTLLSGIDNAFRFPDFFDYQMLKESLVTSLGDIMEKLRRHGQWAVLLRVCQSWHSNDHHHT